VVGQTSWGKGLVQAVMAINRTRGLALTTARYYTPSGRCIQRDYMHGLDDYLLPEETKDPKEAPAPKGPVFKTDLDRVVYGGGGITPDYNVEGDKITPFVNNIRYRNSAFFKFAVMEKEKRGIKVDQVPDDALMARFKTFLAEQKIECAETDWKEAQNQADMRALIGMEMQNVAFGMEAGFRYISGRDPQVKKALDVMAEAQALLKRKQVLARPSPEKSLVAQQ